MKRGESSRDTAMCATSGVIERNKDDTKEREFLSQRERMQVNR
jgi:hypothetical protein